MKEISSNQTVQGLANTVYEVGAHNQIWLFFLWKYLLHDLAFVDDFSLQFIELSQDTMHLLWLFKIAAPSILHLLRKPTK